MKSFFSALLLATSLSALATPGDISCTGSVDEKNVEFVMERNDAGTITTMSVSIDDALILSLSGSEVRVSEHVYGTMISGWPANSYNADQLLVVLDKNDTANLGWVSLYSRGILMRGIELTCQR